MAYRKGYYKKDGTYVNGYFTKTKSNSNNKKNNKGCVNLILALCCLNIITYLIFK